MTSKGQVVIPQDIRDELKLEEGEKFIIYTIDGAVYLRRLGKAEKAASVSDLREAFEPLWKIAKSRKISGKDIEDEIKDYRQEKRNAKADA